MFSATSKHNNLQTTYQNTFLNIIPATKKKHYFQPVKPLRSTNISYTKVDSAMILQRKSTKYSTNVSSVSVSSGVTETKISESINPESQSCTPNINRLRPKNVAVKNIENMPNRISVYKNNSDNSVDNCSNTSKGLKRGYMAVSEDSFQSIFRENNMEVASKRQDCNAGQNINSGAGYFAIDNNYLSGVERNIDFKNINQNIDSEMKTTESSVNDKVDLRARKVDGTSSKSAGTDKELEVSASSCLHTHSGQPLSIGGHGRRQRSIGGHHRSDGGRFGIILTVLALFGAGKFIVVLSRYYHHVNYLQIETSL